MAKSLPHGGAENLTKASQHKYVELHYGIGTHTMFQQCTPVTLTVHKLHDATLVHGSAQGVLKTIKLSTNIFEAFNFLHLKKLF